MDRNLNDIWFLRYVDMDIGRILTLLWSLVLAIK